MTDFQRIIMEKEERIRQLEEMEEDYHRLQREYEQLKSEVGNTYRTGNCQTVAE